MKEVDPAALRKSRRFLLLIALVFAAPMIVAGLLSWSGWQPGTKGNGEPILPQRNFVDEKLQVRLDDGTSWPWRDSKPRFTLVALAGPDCAARCFDTLTGIAKARVMLNRNQSRLRLLYVGAPPVDPGRRAAMNTYWTLGRDVDGKLATWMLQDIVQVKQVIPYHDCTGHFTIRPFHSNCGLLASIRQL